MPWCEIMILIAAHDINSLFLAMLIIKGYELLFQLYRLTFNMT